MTTKDLLKNEVIKAIKDMLNKRATGGEKIPADLLKKLIENGVKMILLNNKI